MQPIDFYRRLIGVAFAIDPVWDAPLSVPDFSKRDGNIRNPVERGPADRARETGRFER